MRVLSIKKGQIRIIKITKYVICMEDIEIGRNVMRLDCDGHHTFCQVCIEGWFSKHNTCPICRYQLDLN